MALTAALAVAAVFGQAAGPGQDEETFTVAPGLRVEPVADGAMVGRVVAMQFAADGRLWALEDGRGTLTILEDTDHDGVMDRRTEFASGLAAARGLVLLGEGALVSLGKDFVFLRDRDGDGRAEERNRVAVDLTEFPGVGQGPNGLFLGLDNWLYLAGSTMRLRYYGAGGFARDYVDRRAGRSVTQDEMGRLYSSGDPAAVEVERIASAYRWRNLGYRGNEVTARIPLARPAGWAEPRATEPPLVFIYRGTRLGLGFDGSLFITEPAAGRMMRQRQSAGGWESIPVLQPRRRGVQLSALTQGADGLLYLSGVVGNESDAGRIWRLASSGPRAGAGAMPAKATLADWVRDLGHADGWRRDTAQRLIIEREDPAAASLLREFASQANPLGRIHALWALDGLDALDQETVLGLVDDPDPRVSATAIRMAEKFLYPPGDPEVLARLARLTKRPEPMVRQQLVLSLGEAAQPAGDAVLVEATIHWGEQAGMLDAILSGLSGRELEFIRHLAQAAPAGSVTIAQAVRDATAGLLLRSDFRRMTMKPEESARLGEVFALVAEEKTPPWLRAAILAGIERLQSTNGKGRPQRVNLTVVPEALMRFANGASAEAARVRTLLGQLNWPGKAASVEGSPRLNGEEMVRYEKGREAFPITCAGCHQPQGQGLPGLAPPLAGSRWVQGDARVVARIVLCGKVQEMYPMPTLRGNFDDETIAAVLTFVRNSWGNSASAVSSADVAAARAATAGRAPMPFTDFELLELADELGRGEK